MHITERIGICPHCLKGEGRGLTTNGLKVGREVDIFAEWNKDGVLYTIYAIGDDDYDIRSSDSNVTEIGISDDQRHVSDIVCPRCKEHVPVRIPIVKKREIAKSSKKENDEESIFKQVS